VGGERGPRIAFRQQDVRGRERQRHLLPQTGDGVQQVAQPFDCEGPHIDGHEEVGTGHERRLRPEAEGRWRIDHHHIEGVQEGVQRLFQLPLAIATPQQLWFQVCERRVRRKNVQMGARMPAEGLHLGSGAREEVSHGGAHVRTLDAQGQGSVPPGIAIDQKHALLCEHR
jgi:hypothetical protein